MIILQRMKKLVLHITIGMFGILIFIVLFQIASRNIFGRSYAQLEELALIILPWFGFFAATYTLYMGDHVQIDFFYNKFPTYARKGLFITVQLVILVMIATLSYHSLGLAIRQMKVVTPSLGWPVGIKYIGFPLCSPFMASLIIHNIFRAFLGKFNDNQGLTAIQKGGGKNGR